MSRRIISATRGFPLQQKLFNLPNFPILTIQPLRNNYPSTFYRTTFLSDEPNIVAALEEAGATYISADAGSSAEQQLADVENLMAQGADVLIILAQDGEAILPAVASALEQGVPVIAYDRLIENPGALYITFDNVKVPVENLLGKEGKGIYVILSNFNVSILRRILLFSVLT